MNGGMNEEDEVKILEQEGCLLAHGGVLPAKLGPASVEHIDEATGGAEDQLLPGSNLDGLAC